MHEIGFILFSYELLTNIKNVSNYLSNIKFSRNNSRKNVLRMDYKSERYREIRHRRKTTKANYWRIKLRQNKYTDIFLWPGEKGCLVKPP